MDYLMANIVVRRLQACAGFHARCRMRASGCLRLGPQAEIHPPVSAGGKSSAIFLSLLHVGFNLLTAYYNSVLIEQ